MIRTRISNYGRRSAGEVFRLTGPLQNFDISNVRNLQELFSNWSSEFQPKYAAFQDINQWDVRNVNVMDGMFKGCASFDQPLNSWDVGNVTRMSHMFDGCRLFNQPLNSWTVGNVQRMGHMFEGCTSFNQPLDSWNVGNVERMHRMFEGCTSFNQPLDSWTVGNVQQMARMFDSCTSFNQPLNSWNVSSVELMNHMFEKCTSFNQPLDLWDVSSVEQMISMFEGCTSFNQLLNSWDVSNVSRMSQMFDGCTSFNQPLDLWDVVNIESMSGMFQGCTSFNQPLNSWVVDNVTIMRGMFQGCTSFNQPLNSWQVGANVSMLQMFTGCTNFFSPVFAMTCQQYEYSGLPDTPLGQTDVMQVLITKLRRSRDQLNRENARGVMTAAEYNQRAGALRDNERKMIANSSYLACVKEHHGESQGAFMEERGQRWARPAEVSRKSDRETLENERKTLENERDALRKRLQSIDTTSEQLRQEYVARQAAFKRLSDSVFQRVGQESRAQTEEEIDALATGAAAVTENHFANARSQAEAAAARASVVRSLEEIDAKLAAYVSGVAGAGADGQTPTKRPRLQ